MSSKQKLYSQLARRQRRRRRIIFEKKWRLDNLPTEDERCTQSASPINIDQPHLPSSPTASQEPPLNLSASYSHAADIVQFSESSDTSKSSSEDSDDQEDTDHSKKDFLDDSPTLYDSEKVEAAIVNWMLDCPRVPLASVSKLMRHMHHFFPGVHLTAKTLTKNLEPNVSIEEMHFGRYVHFNNWVQDLVLHLNSHNWEDDVTVNLNVDGIPIFNDSRKYHAYPVLIDVRISTPKIICVGMYLSESEISNKMPDVNQLLQKFVEDFTELQVSGVKLNNHLTVPIQINAIIADAPARADLKKIVGHASYHSCERCIQKGSYNGGHVTLLDLDACKRTDESFTCKNDLNHHKEGTMSCLKNLGIGLVTQFPLDYMHLVLLGVMKRLMKRWKSSKRAEFKANLSLEKQSIFNSLIESFSSHIPSEFARKLRGGLHTISFWKATEFRLYLLYVGVAMMHLFPENQNLNYLLLCCSVRLLLMKNQSDNMKSVSKMLKNFVITAKTIYGNGFVSYNVHSLIHLSDDYSRYGPLGNISAFKFENYLGSIIKGRLSGRNKPLEQICRHVSLENARIVEKKPHISTKYKAAPGPAKDNCILLRTGQVAYITNITSGNLTADFFVKFESLFKVPFNSSLVGIFKVHAAVTKGNRVPLADVKNKMMLLPVDNFFIGITLLHD